MGQDDSELGTDAGLAARLRAARNRSFVGRWAELDLFRTALAAEVPPFAVLHLHGPGGIGKTALLRRFADEARQAGRHPVLVDGRRIDPSPEGFLAELAADLDVSAEGVVDALVERGDPVLLVDTYEALTPLDGWLRDRVIPRLPARSLVVLAGRNPPDPGWRTDPAWDELLRVIALRDLQTSDARELLETRGIEASRHDEVLEVARGHPLALVLVAEVLAQQDPDVPFALEDAPDVIDQLLRRFLRGLPSGPHRHALHVAAHAGVATEALLRATVDDGDAVALFNWLRDRSFTDVVPGGVAVHDLVGDALNAELRWRDPDGYVALHRAVTRHLERRLVSTSGAEQQRAMLDLLQLYRFHPLTRSFFDWDRTEQLWLEPATPDDHAAIIDLTRAHEGDASAEIAAYWLARQPEAFTAFRSAPGVEPAGFAAHLLLGDTPGEESEVDPVAAAVWRHTRGRAPLRPGEHLRILRFWIARDTYQGIATHHLVSARSAIDWVTTDRLAWSVVVLADPDFYEPIFTFIDFERSPDLAVTIGDHRFGMFTRDHRTTSQREWRKLLQDRRIREAEQPSQLRPSAERRLVLAHDDFIEAVRDALRGMARPGGLAGNPLLRSSVVADSAEDQPAEEVLVDLIHEAVNELTTHPRDEKLRRAVELTYLRPAPTQEAAAQRLDLPFSTFRRHLTAGVDHITTWLWERELHGPPPPDERAV